MHDLGLTVVMAEHRLERVLPFADRIVLVPGGGQPLEVGPPQTIMRSAPVAPPLIELGRSLGWDPLPLTVRDARRLAPELRARIASKSFVRSAARSLRSGEEVASPQLAVHVRTTGGAGRGRSRSACRRDHRSDGPQWIGQILAAHALEGTRTSRGSVRVGGQDPKRMSSAQLIRAVGLVPQEPGILLYGESVAEECRNADRASGLDEGTTNRTLDRLLPGMPLDRHPRDLSEGQRLALALAIVLAPEPPVLLLDEPTRGLDYPSKDRLVSMLQDLAETGHAIVLATHDVELAAGGPPGHRPGRGRSDRRRTGTRGCLSFARVRAADLQGAGTRRMVDP